MSAIGIDFGTTNSVVAVHRDGQTEVLEIDQPPVQWQPYGFDKVLPSVMARDENERICFGWEAKQRTTGRFDAVKRMFATQLDVATDDQGESLVVEEVATMLFAELRQRAVAQGIDANQAVVTVPANSKGRARHRTKLAVRSHRAGVSPKGSLIGPMGSRANAVMEELHGEKIDIVDWSEDPAQFVAHALSPAKVTKVEIVDLATRSAKVTVPDYQLSLAIGKDGQNARLAARLTGWRIDIHPDTPITPK